MLIALLKGIVLGLSLSILVGPLVFALIQSTLERGLTAGLMVGLGIWISDLLFITVSWWGVNWVIRVSSWPGFETSLSIAGGIILLGIGAGLIFRPAGSHDRKTVLLGLRSSLFGEVLKGFLVNTVNPFTIFFWISVMTVMVRENELDQAGTGLFVGGIMGTIVLTDSLKVLFARKVRHWLSPRHIFLFRRISGLILTGFGLFLLFRVL